ncbi:MAG: signal peptidase II [Balneolales bacterium]|nr:signal peptidase II [Balneolales bacterium]
MTDSAKKITWFSVVAVIVVILDQWSKNLVRTNPDLHYTILIDGVLAFNLTSNPGMAMGITWAPTWVISLVAIFATIGISWYAFSLIKQANIAFMALIGLIIGGALGNIMDRLYMGYVGGYGGLLEGHVVDFIHFTWVWPEWMPLVGGSPSFPYIFNVADIAISVAVISMILFMKWVLPEEPPKNNSTANKNTKGIDQNDDLDTSEVAAAIVEQIDEATAETERLKKLERSKTSHQK